jgi:isocitrate/isopropylmalate dehydrogenase
MMLEMLGEKEAANNVEKAIMKVTPQMSSMRAAEMGHTTSEVGDLVAAAI